MPSGSEPMNDMFFVAKEAEEMARAVTAAIMTPPTAERRIFYVEANKAFVAAGTRGEVDLYVREGHPAGSNRIHAFECKPRTAPVEQREIAAFSQRLELLQADRGYFVGPSFTPEAR